MTSELSQANADSIKASSNLANAREIVTRGIDENCWSSLLFYLNLQTRCNVNNLKSRQKNKLEKIPERQDGPLKNLDNRILDEVFSPQWGFLCFGPKILVRDSLNEIHLLSDFDSFFVKAEVKMNIRRKIIREKSSRKNICNKGNLDILWQKLKKVRVIDGQGSSGFSV